MVDGFKLRAVLALLCLVKGCAENSLPSEDLAAPPRDARPEIQLDYPSVEGLAFDVAGPYVVYAGLTRLITPASPDLGEMLPRVHITVFDMAQAKVVETESSDEGVFAFAVPLPNGPFDGYIELAKEGYPTVRQFDRPFSDHWTNMRLRMLDQNLFSLPRNILGQAPDRGYIQGSVYDRNTEAPIRDVTVEASAGEVAYLQDGIPVPSKDLKATKSLGVFFVANCPPGPVTIRASVGGRPVAQRTVLTWGTEVLTQVGIPIEGLDQGPIAR